MKTLADFDWQGKIALLRTDLNVPLSADGSVADDARLVAAAASVREVLEKGGGVVVLSHLGRPQEGGFDAALSLEGVAAAFSTVLQYPVRFCPEMTGVQPAAGEVLMLENTRFNVGEKHNDGNLARRYAALGDVFVMDAFASAHRAEASVAALAHAGLPACAGRLVQAELQVLERVVGKIARPLVGIFGGAKISTKLAVLRRMAGLCDTLLVGGGMANTLLLAQGKAVGASLVQEDMLAEAAAVLDAAKGTLLPCDVVVGAAGASGRMLPLQQVTAADAILDIGPETQAAFAAAVESAQTIIWNGPMGMFEDAAYAAGTVAVAQAVAASPAYSLAGGADTIAALRSTGVLDKISYVSTAGGALLEYLGGAKMPGLDALAD